jgi:hypothetical protein
VPALRPPLIVAFLRSVQRLLPDDTYTLFYVSDVAAETLSDARSSSEPWFQASTGSGHK